jgi:hypothetical protein
MLKQVAIIATLAHLSGCASNVIPPPYKQLSTSSVTIFDPGDPRNKKYSVIDKIEGIDCSPTWFRFANSHNAIEKLISEAETKGANGVMNISCIDSKLGPIMFCNNSVTCSATAVVVE